MCEWACELNPGLQGRLRHLNEDVEPAMRKACEYDADANAIHLARAVRGSPFCNWNFRL